MTQKYYFNQRDNIIQFSKNNKKIFLFALQVFKPIIHFNHENWAFPEIFRTPLLRLTIFRIHTPWNSMFSILKCHNRSFESYGSSKIHTKPNCLSEIKRLSKDIEKIDKSRNRFHIFMILKVHTDSAWAWATQW